MTWCCDACRSRIAREVAMDVKTPTIAATATAMSSHLVRGERLPFDCSVMKARLGWTTKGDHSIRVRHRRLRFCHWRDQDCAGAWQRRLVAFATPRSCKGCAMRLTREYELRSMAISGPLRQRC